MKVSTEKKVKVKKLTAKGILQRLVEAAQTTLSPEGEVGYESKVAFTELEFKRLVELAAPKEKKG